MFATLSDRLSDTFKNLRGKGKLSEADIDATAREIRIALLEADVALPVVKDFVAAVKERARGAEVSQALNPAQQVIKIVNEELVAILGGETRRLRFAKNPPTVIMLAGLQGAGKTTLAAKLALWLKEQGKSPLLVAADLQRPNAVNQLQVNGERAGVTVFAPEPGNGVGDPVAVARGVDRGGPAHPARRRHRRHRRPPRHRRGADAAGRGHPRRGQPRRGALRRRRDDRPGRGQHRAGVPRRRRVRRRRAHQARRRRPRWRRAVDREDHRQAGHVRLQRREAHRLRRVPPRPDGLAHPRHGRPAHPDRAGREDLRRRPGREGRGQAAGQGGEFTLDDFLEQMQQVRKMGSLSKMLGMLPGMGQFRDQLENFDEREIDRIQAIIQSMTPAERANPKMIDGSRRARIAKGSGRQVSDVNQLVDRFFEARKMMQQMARGGGIPGMPGMPGMGLGKKAKGRQAPQPKKGKGKRGLRQPGQARPAGGREGRSRPPRAGRPSGSARTTPYPTTSTPASCRTCRST